MIPRSSTRHAGVATSSAKAKSILLNYSGVLGSKKGGELNLLFEAVLAYNPMRAAIACGGAHASLLGEGAPDYQSVVNR